MVNQKEGGFTFPDQFPAQGNFRLLSPEHAERIDTGIKDTLDVWEKDGREISEGLVEQVRTFFVNDPRDDYRLSYLLTGLGKKRNANKDLIQKVTKMVEGAGIRWTGKKSSLLLPLGLAIPVSFEIVSAQPKKAGRPKVKKLKKQPRDFLRFIC